MQASSPSQNVGTSSRVRYNTCLTCTNMKTSIYINEANYEVLARTKYCIVLFTIIVSFHIGSNNPIHVLYELDTPIFLKNAHI